MPAAPVLLYISKAKTKIILSNNSIIEIYGYDEMVDKMYSKLNENNYVFIYGRLERGKVIIKLLRDYHK